MTYLEKVNAVDNLRTKGKYSARIASEICYLDGLAKIKNDKAIDSAIEKACDFVLAKAKEEDAITKATCLEAEEMLKGLSSLAKSYNALFISHAHIDMNWMWGYNETASITVDTFRTVLDLMKEYPEMTYAQSQASTYEIIEKYAPEMIDEIKERVKEGRWELVATEWVEPDKNMPDGESLTRHILQTKKYLSNLLDVSADSLCIDFVPDTFGHNVNVPEILQNAGVKYMYHCRGSLGPDLYNYVAPSGKSVLAYREHGWYNGAVNEQNFEVLPEFCRTYGVDTFMTVFGVGDHGGGPSRRDIEHIIEYSTWPLTPSIRFGTMKEFFEKMDAFQKANGKFKEIDTELNCIFTGCYTTQSRIKAANRFAEARMNEAEALNSMSSFAKKQVVRHDFDASWRKILFNHFHDILPGSCTPESREYALGMFQESMADISTSANAAMKAVAANIDTSSIATEDAAETTSEGAGVGYYRLLGDSRYITSADRGRGQTRILHFFNTTSVARKEYTEFIIWDYNYPNEKIEVVTGDGKTLDFTIVGRGKGYWGHTYKKLGAVIEIAPYGYTTVLVKQKTEDGHLAKMPVSYEWSDEWLSDAPVVMENEYIVAKFARNTMKLISLYDKEEKKELVSKPTGSFKLIMENPCNQMTSWMVGPYMSISDINDTYNVKVTNETNNKLTHSLKYEIKLNSTVINCEVALRSQSRVIEYNSKIDWEESAVHEECIPSIVFAFDAGYEVNGKCLYDIPYATIERKELAHDVPSLSYATIGAKEGNAVSVITDCKYGFRIYDKCASVTLLRSAYDPDPYPDRGIQDIRIGLAVSKSEEMTDISKVFNHPFLYVSGTSHEGKLPLDKSFVTSDGADIVCLKQSEASDGIVVRLVERSGKDCVAALKFNQSVKEAYLCDSLENQLEKLEVKNDTVKVKIGKYSIASLKVKI